MWRIMKQFLWAGSSLIFCSSSAWKCGNYSSVVRADWPRDTPHCCCQEDSLTQLCMWTFNTLGQYAFHICGLTVYCWRLQPMAFASCSGGFSANTSRPHYEGAKLYKLPLENFPHECTSRVWSLQCLVQTPEEPCIHVIYLSTHPVPFLQ